MAVVYLSQAVLDQLATAQAVIGRHIVSCALCGANRRCDERDRADDVFMRYGRLPRGTPGLTRPQSTGSFAWLNKEGQHDLDRTPPPP